MKCPETVSLLKEELPYKNRQLGLKHFHCGIPICCFSCLANFRAWSFSSVYFRINMMSSGVKPAWSSGLT
jgi:hypothetical protein